jgi:Fic family protein
MENVYTFRLDLGWKLIDTISRIDRFDASWTSIEKRETKNLKQLKSIATVRSVGASTRIEGSSMSDEEVAVLIENLSVLKLEDRDSQEVAGYFTVLDIVSESYEDIEINEGTLKNLHNILLKFSEKDLWHRGNYKQHSNVVEATTPGGSKQVIFQTTAPGMETETAMGNLIDWYQRDNETHALVKAAIFCYDFLSIHPFQDGNGRLSRLLATLLLMKHQYKWIQYVSFEQEIETNKTEYYRVLIECQRRRPGENISTWVYFFLHSLQTISGLLMQKLDVSENETQMTVREKSIYLFIENHPGCQTRDIAGKLNIPLSTVKRILTGMADRKMIISHGKSRGSNYTLA